MLFRNKKQNQAKTTIANKQTLSVSEVQGKKMSNVQHLFIFPLLIINILQNYYNIYVRIK